MKNKFGVLSAIFHMKKAKTVFFVSSFSMLFALMALEFVFVQASGMMLFEAMLSRIRFLFLPEKLSAFIEIAALNYYDFPLVYVITEFGDQAGSEYILFNIGTFTSMIIIAALSGIGYCALYFIRNKCRSKNISPPRGLTLLLILSILIIGLGSQSISLMGGCCGGLVPTAFLSTAIGEVGFFTNVLVLMSVHGRWMQIIGPIILLLVLSYSFYVIKRLIKT